MLSSSGHIAGIVNPPNPKAKHWVNDSLPADPHKWREHAQLVEATWWQDWTAWIAERGGDLVPAPEQLGANGGTRPAFASNLGVFVLQRGLHFPVDGHHRALARPQRLLRHLLQGRCSEHPQTGRPSRRR